MSELRAGIVLSIALLLFGLSLAVVRRTAFDLLSGTPVDLSTLAARLADLDPTAFVLLGFLTLIATPIGRVVASLVGFANARDGAFVVLTASVLGILALSVAVGAVT
ncbi:MAG: DUF1634 domain-containing protein [Thermoplasmata archaeon]